jgi:hypothetical protein
MCFCLNLLMIQCPTIALTQLVALGHAITSLFVGIRARQEPDNSVRRQTHLAASVAGVAGGGLLVVISTLISIGLRIGGHRLALGFWLGSTLISVVNAAQQAGILSSNTQGGVENNPDAYVAGLAVSVVAAFVYLCALLALPFYSSLFNDDPGPDADSDRQRLQSLTSSRRT